MRKNICLHEECHSENIYIHRELECRKENIRGEVKR